MLSISFLPWVLLLVGIIISIPAAAAIDAAKRKRELEAFQGDHASGDGDGGSDGNDQGDAVYEDDGGGVFDEVPVGGVSQTDVYGGDSGGDFGGDSGSERGIFDDDAFK